MRTGLGVTKGNSILPMEATSGMRGSAVTSMSDIDHRNCLSTAVHSEPMMDRLHGYGS